METDQSNKGADNPAFQPDDEPTYANVETEKGEVVAEAQSDAEQGAGERQQWSSGLEFLLSCVAMSVGLGNVWRFPFTAYANGGGAFLIPYIIVLIVIGRPLYYLEMGLGQFTSRGCVKVWNMVPAIKGVGYGQILSTCCVLSYYMSLMAITLYYLGASFSSELPWSKCRAEWDNCVPSTGVPDGTADNTSRPSAELYFLEVILRENDIREDGLGAPDWRLTLCLLGAWLLVIAVVIKGVQSSGKAAYFLALFPYIVLTVLLIRGATLPGAGDGVLFFVKPQWDKLGDAKVWHAAVTQAFFSLNVGFGSLINYASFNNFRHNIYTDAMIVTTLDTFTSLLAGCTIFSILGNLAYNMNADVETVVRPGAGLAFVSYPDAIAKFDAVPQLFAVLFFLMLLTLGLGSAVALFTAVTTIINDNLPHVRQWIVVTCVSVVAFGVGLVFVTPGGQWVLTLVDHFGATYPVLALMCIEVAVISWHYGVDTLCEDLRFMLDRKAGPYWRLTWGLITPVFIIAVFIYALATDERLEYGEEEFPDHYYVVGWILMAGIVSMCPIFIIKEVITKIAVEKHSLLEALRASFLPNDAWGPSDKQEREDWLRDKERLRAREEAAGEGPVKKGVRKLCGCGRLPVLDDDDGGSMAGREEPAPAP